PSYIQGENEDDIDSQIRALSYMFKRLEIYNLPNFLADENGIYRIPDPTSNNLSHSPISSHILYNRTEFERILINDKHRILIDWSKNKFRSLLILSNHPKNLTFKFSILNASSTLDNYLHVLVNKSNFYIEHPIEKRIKRILVKHSYNKQWKVIQSENRNFVNKDDRYKIIKGYLERLAFHVQVERIFK
ncbi:uncharacterized protein ASCRUDRAFT_23012, partial [Ascoidea rubescens DSM 1968]